MKGECDVHVPHLIGNVHVTDRRLDVELEGQGCEEAA